MKLKIKNEETNTLQITIFENMKKYVETTIVKYLDTKHKNKYCSTTDLIFLELEKLVQNINEMNLNNRNLKIIRFNTIDYGVFTNNKDMKLFELPKF